MWSWSCNTDTKYRLCYCSTSHAWCCRAMLACAWLCSIITVLGNRKDVILSQGHYQLTALQRGILDSHSHHSGAFWPKWTTVMCCLIYDTWWMQYLCFLCLSAKSLMCILWRPQMSAPHFMDEGLGLKVREMSSRLFNPAIPRAVTLARLKQPAE